MANKKKKEPVKKEEFSQKGGGCGGGCVSFFILLFMVAGLYCFVEENISEDALLTLKIIGISLLALFVVYIGYKLYKFIYSHSKKLFKNKKSEQDESKTSFNSQISIMEKELEELNHELDELQNTMNELSQEAKNENKTPSEQNESRLNLTYDEIKSLPEYKIIKEYVSKLKIIDLKKFINELSPFDQDRTCLVLSALIADETLTEYTEGHCIYAEYDAILSSVDSMSENGIEFEHFTVELLLKNGFTNVKRTQSSGDYGIDVLAEKDSVTYAIQCKCYSNPVGNKAVQEAYSGKDFYRCMVAVVFTNNYFTKSAIETAKQNNVILWDRNKLIELIKPLQNSNHTNNDKKI